jgi:enamine deaminase RidA (YjgF/YER057c/UK114 family)
MTQEKQNKASMDFLSRRLRRFQGPEATEIHICCQPEPGIDATMEAQAQSVYATLLDTLASEGGAPEDVIQEFVFFRNIQEDGTSFEKARQAIFASPDERRKYSPALTLIEQPPLNDSSDLTLSAFAVIPNRRTSGGAWQIQTETADGRCFDAHLYGLGGSKYMCAGNIYGTGSTYEETYSMFSAAKDLLQIEGMEFRDVIRTWIQLRHMERDYDEFNRGRRDFFRDNGISLRPASTGIQGSPARADTDILLSFYAIRASRPLEVAIMTTPTLNEAWTYGSDFSRGLRVVESNRTALYISGTASVDEEGRTAHLGDTAAQIERMLLNIETLLSAQNASFSDLVSAITYLKDKSEADVLRKILKQRGLGDLPNALVEADICRDNLLCEMEAVAALPLDRSTNW